MAEKKQNEPKFLSGVEKHWRLDDATLAKQFEETILDPHLFSHEAHLRLGWINVKRLGSIGAGEALSSQISSFAAKLGEHSKFNKTVTVASCFMIDHFASRSKSTNFKEFLKEFPRMKTHFKELLSAHYSQDIFNDPKAKKEYIEPDLLPFTNDRLPQE